MNARDELAEIIANFRDDWYKVARKSPAGIDRDEADAILAAGYSKPRTISTVEELDGLAFESVIRDAGGFILERWGDEDAKLWTGVMRQAFIPRGDIALPATVLYTPKES